MYELNFAEIEEDVNRQGERQSQTKFSVTQALILAQTAAPVV